MIVFVWVWISAQSSFISNYLLLKVLRNEPNFSMPVQMQVWEPNSGFTPGFGVCGFSPSGLSISYLEKNALCGSRHFLACTLLPVHLLVVIYQNANSEEGRVVKATYHHPSISKLVCIMTTLFPPRCQY